MIILTYAELEAAELEGHVRVPLSLVTAGRGRRSVPFPDYRVGLSLAPGAGRRDFMLTPAAYEDRHRQTVEGIALLRGLWRGEPYHDEQHDVTVRTLPRPVQPDLPLWLTCGGSPQGFVDAGRAGVGVLTHLMSQSVDDLRANIDRYRDETRRHHGGHHEPHVTLMVHAYVATDDDRARATAESPLESYLIAAMNMFGGADVGGARARVAVRPALRRYLGTDGLIGSVDTAVERARLFADLGVDELACLVDFGVGAAAALDGLAHLDVVRQRTTGLMRV